eukprot:5911417-Prymnesium_polylepis.2
MYNAWAEKQWQRDRHPSISSWLRRKGAVQTELCSAVYTYRTSISPGRRWRCAHTDPLCAAPDVGSLRE